MRTTKAALFPTLAVALNAGLMTVPAHAQTLPRPIYSTFTDQANRTIPGSGGQFFNTGGIDLVRVSSNGQWWALKGNRIFPATPPATGQNTSRDEVVVGGTASDTAVTGTLILGEQDGYPAFTTGLVANELPGTVTANGPVAVNNSGRFAISALSPLPVASNANRVIVRGQLSTAPAVTEMEIYGREGSSLPGVPGYNFGQDHFVDGMADNGDPLFRSQRMGAANKQVLMRGSTVLAETVDGAQIAPFIDEALTVPDNAYAFFVPASSAGFLLNPMTTPDGQHWAVVGQLTGSFDMLVVDSRTRLKELSFLPEDQDFPVVDVGISRMASDGRWITRAATGVYNFVRSGDVNLTRSGVACVPCFEYAWRDRAALNPDTGTFGTSTGFGNVAINASGRWVVSGLNNSASSLDNSLVVVDGRTVLLRERQALDLDGDGVANDDAILLGLDNDSVQLTDGGWLWFIADVNRPQASIVAGAPVDGSVLFRMQLPPRACGLADIAGPGQAVGADGELTADDIIVFLNKFFAANLCADVAGPGQNTTALDGELTADDIIVFLNRFFAACPV